MLDVQAHVSTSGWNYDTEQCLFVKDKAGQPLWLLLRVEFSCTDSDNPSWKLVKDMEINSPDFG